MKIPVSLAARLSAWYAASCFLLLLVACGLLYWVLLDSSDYEDDQYLNEKANVLATLLSAHAPDSPIVQWEVQAESSARPLARVLSRIIAPDGRIVAETRGMSEELPEAMIPVLIRSGTAATGGIEIESRVGIPYRILSRSSGPDVRGGYLIRVAIETTYEEKLLSGYRKRIWIVLGCGLGVSILIGYGIARRGLKPVAEIAASIRHIRSTTLTEHLPLRGLPGELTSLAATFNEMLDRLEEAFARLGRFSSDIAHELRTPINNLRGEIEVTLAKPRAPAEYQEALGSSLEECRRISTLIDSLLFLARAESPETRIRRDSLDLKEELGKIKDFYGASAAESGILLEVECAAGTFAALDRPLFQRAVGNLIENSLAHTPRGGRIAIAVEVESETFRITVSDNGTGIAAQHLEHIFDRFYRADPARSKHEGGSGLGLAIVRSIARLHGGTVSVKSEPGQGTSVTLMFPGKK